VQDEEENFDLNLISALEIDVVPHLGDMRLPDTLVSQLGKVLHQGSMLRGSGLALPDCPTLSLPSSGLNAVNDHNSLDRTPRESVYAMVGENFTEQGKVDSGSLVPRERFSFWCLDLLFLICSDTAKGECSSLLISSHCWLRCPL
jgi:hypothetical protein